MTTSFVVGLRARVVSCDASVVGRDEGATHAVLDGLLQTTDRFVVERRVLVVEVPTTNPAP